jgi:hypothetical protein
MKGFSELLLEDYSGKVLDPDGQDYAKRIDLASQRMSVLVEDLLPTAGWRGRMSRSPRSTSGPRSTSCFRTWRRSFAWPRRS